MEKKQFWWVSSLTGFSLQGQGILNQYPVYIFMGSGSGDGREVSG